MILHRVLTLAKKIFQTDMLLQSFENEPDGPAFPADGAISLAKDPDRPALIMPGEDQAKEIFRLMNRITWENHPIGLDPPSSAS
ncbi:hypothetical protein OYT88_13815 [Sporolactobacillus sp. CQH2019]|uniref:hypothetical protein n=1 Tax=Sporolactobacillus sp. CQH2019 TaxID=3023512 RepID=UPI0023686B1B|nr:hypothetical protein [Sporolactobacillus sp. CQH2019]MDD9149625.1 hypothetical protein [Sporolactobacillus sp. CQH2019]